MNNNNKIFLHEDLLREAIRKFGTQTPLLIYGAFGSGKATFMDRFITEYGREKPHILVRINFQNFPPEVFDSLNSLWEQIIISIAEQTEQDPELVPQFWEQYYSLYPPSVIATRFLVNTLNKLDKPLLLVLENAHKVVNQPYVNDFFANLRSPTQERGVFDDLSLIVSMISDADEVKELGSASTFFNVSKGIELSPLSDLQISSLLKSHGLIKSDETVLKIKDTVLKIKELLGGNLYFIGILLEHLAAARNQDINQVFLGSDLNYIFEDGLKTIRSLISDFSRAQKISKDKGDYREESYVEEILEEFKDTDERVIERNNNSKRVYDGLAKIGILNREYLDPNIIRYRIQGSLFRLFVNGNSQDFRPENFSVFS